MRPIRCWQIDAFTDHAFGGNPAAVCWLEQEAETSWMQSMAAEMNLSETAFVRRVEGGHELRWFTPTIEVDLCGHATLATAKAIWTDDLAPQDEPLQFRTRSGVLTCQRIGDLIELNFPATPPTPIPVTDLMCETLGTKPLFVGQSRFYQMAVLENAELVRTVRPNYSLMKQIPTLGVIVTAESDVHQFDFVSRFFAPSMGVDEDPVCGSAHCCLAPYWGKRLEKSTLTAFQASARGGILHLRNEDDRVSLGGQAVVVWRGDCYC